ncbi:MAG: hypothetical protein J1E98_09715 [Lachnospiraceae bacterium]|nr:hypothetical protein [Lachnospiraceae bacterium]
MIKRICFTMVITIIMTITLTACSHSEDITESDIILNKEIISEKEDKTLSSIDETGILPDDIADETDTFQNNDIINEEVLPPSEQENESTDIMIENPSESYYCIDSIESSGENNSFILEKLTEEKNNITDTEKWFEDNELETIDSNVIEDERYRYELEGDDGSSKYLLHIYDKVSGNYLKTLDFSQYRYASEYREEDYDFIEQRIWWVQSEGDTLYVSISHNTYTNSCPNHGYIVAIDLDDSSVIWKTDPGITNSRNFAIIDNTIVCGYGFTDEPDYINLVNMDDGTLIEQIDINSKADYIICKDDILYVRTYNTNYTFQVCRLVICK